MTHFTSDTYVLKREILNFSNKISKNLSSPDRKLFADMTYGILTSGSCLLTDITDCLHETSKKVNSVERLTRHLNRGVSSRASKAYLAAGRKWAPKGNIRLQDVCPVKSRRHKRKGSFLLLPAGQGHPGNHGLCKRKGEAPVPDKAFRVQAVEPAADYLKSEEENSLIQNTRHRTGLVLVPCRTNKAIISEKVAKIDANFLLYRQR